jgi:hypothetical protein
VRRRLHLPRRGRSRRVASSRPAALSDASTCITAVCLVALLTVSRGPRAGATQDAPSSEKPADENLRRSSLDASKLPDLCTSEIFDSARKQCSLDRHGHVRASRQRTRFR